MIGLASLQSSAVARYAELVGQRGARERLPTPALVVDIEALDRNIARMATFSKASAISLRPHVKTHKCVEIARRQLKAGAAGLSCATVDEAEVMAAGTEASILITSPIVTEDKIARFVALTGAYQSIATVVDHPEAARRIASRARSSGVVASVFVDLDVGHHRSGTATPEDAVALAKKIAGDPSLKLCGIQAYAGHLQHVINLAERKRQTREVASVIRTVRTAIESIVSSGVVVSGGGTGTCRIDAEEEALTELQVGSYVFLDTDYGAVDLGLSVEDQFEVALFLRASVTSINWEGFFSIDAGTKAFALNGPPPRCVSEPWGDAGFRFMGDEHAHLLTPKNQGRPSLGHGLEFVVPHCDPTVHHFDHYYVVRGQDVIGVWDIDARGRR